MKLTPAHEPDNSWSLLDPAGRTVRRSFADQGQAAQWALDNGHEVFETGGGPVHLPPQQDIPPAVEEEIVDDLDLPEPEEDL